MYRYDTFDRQFVAERVEHYRAQTARYLAGELTEDEFLQLRLRNGLYIQRLAPMLRVAVPYGTLSSTQLRQLAHIARHYDRGYGHLSTRQNMQFNWPLLEEVPDILATLAEVDMHAIQTSGNCIRNVTTDQFAGVSGDEWVDPRPYCELIRQWSTSHPEFDWLPRKFKIAVSAAGEDRAAIAVHDIGLKVHRGESGAVLFDVYVGGGLGRTPVIGQRIRADLGVRHLLTYLEAIMRVYNRYGRRDNKYKARIKILVRAMTAEGFRQRVDDEWSHLVEGPSTLTDEEIARMESHFLPPDYPALPDADDLDQQRLASPAFSRWVEHNVAAHRVPGWAIVTLSTKITGVPPGDVSDRQMEAVADWADEYGFGEIRISHEQNFVLPDVPRAKLFELWERAVAQQLAASNAGLLSDIICCPGGDYCSLANAKSIPVAEAIQAAIADLDYEHDLGPIDLNISGCMNACGHHHVGHIGILGVDKKGSEFYQISLGGHAGHGGVAASLGQIVGPSVSRADVPRIIEDILDTYVAHRDADETFLGCFHRIGIEPFKERIYGTA
jgi:sulfite reductase (NADPH) hemoprotein beta-component